MNKRYEIDPETAPFVRLIFDKAIEGWNNGRIVNYLNEQGVPTPGIFLQKRTGKPVSNRVVSDEEWLWDTWKVHRVLKNYSYTGSMVHGKYTSLSVGINSRKRTDKKDWYILENTHDAIVSVEEWEAAQGAINSQLKPSVRLRTDYLLLGKLRCGVCGLAMEYHDAATPVVYCSHAQSAGKASKCCRTKHDAKRIESLVAYELRWQIQLL